MGLQKLIIILVFVAVLGGSFAAVYYMPDVTRKTDPEKTTVPPASQEKAVADVTGNEETRLRPAQDGTSPHDIQPKEPLTCEQASKLGNKCIGQRVTWVGKRILSQSATIDKQNGTQHIFESRGPEGQYSFDHPFIAEDPAPLPPIKSRSLDEPPKKPRSTDEIRASVRERARRHHEPPIFTVTGTIIRIDTLIMLGRGTRHNVPVLANVEMSK